MIVAEPALLLAVKMVPLKPARELLPPLVMVAFAAVLVPSKRVLPPSLVMVALPALAESPIWTPPRPSIPDRPKPDVEKLRLRMRWSPPAIPELESSSAVDSPSRLRQPGG